MREKIIAAFLIAWEASKRVEITFKKNTSSDAVRMLLAMISDDIFTLENPAHARLLAGPYENGVWKEDPQERTIVLIIKNYDQQIEDWVFKFAKYFENGRAVEKAAA